MDFDKSFQKFEKYTCDQSLMVHGDCFELLSILPSESIHAVVTDPPYGLKEYQHDQVKKMEDGKGGIWRIPPTFDGANRAPLPRFTALTDVERQELRDFFAAWSKELHRVLVPGAHVLVAGNSFLSQMVFTAITEGNLEFRGEVIRLVRTLRGGDKPKNAEAEFPNVSSLPRGCYEPWGLFRKPLPPKMTVAECLRLHGTGGLRRIDDERPFEDVIESERTPKAERLLANHPSIKPQSFMRKVVAAMLPTTKGVILDTFMGSGSTLAAANYLGLQSLGFEFNSTYFNLAKTGVPKLQLVDCSPQAELLLA